MSGRFDLSNKVAIVTGAGRGIGKKISIGLAEHGADLVLCSRTKSQLDLVAGEIRQKGRQVLIVPIDISNTSQLDDLIDKTINKFGHIDILVNNAGTAECIDATDVDENHWNTIMNTNAKSPFFLSQKVAKIMIKQGKGGSIINITSENVDCVEKTPLGVYAPSKAALNSITKILARQWGVHKIRVNSLAPCFVKTELNEQVIETNRDWYENKLKDVPIGRVSEPEDLVGPAILLASDASKYISGTTILVDGGYTA